MQASRRLESFELDHTRVRAPYVRLAARYVGPRGDVVTKYDLRLVQPNRAEIPTAALHTMEHLLAGYLRGGAGPSEPQVQEAVTRHYKWVCRTWTPDRAAYVGLGRMYVEDERFTQNLDRVEPGLAAFLRDAIEVWAPAHLN